MDTHAHGDEFGPTQPSLHRGQEQRAFDRIAEHCLLAGRELGGRGEHGRGEHLDLGRTTRRPQRRDRSGSRSAFGLVRAHDRRLTDRLDRIEAPHNRALRAIACAPSASAAVTVATRPSSTAATATATPTRNASSAAAPRDGMTPARAKVTSRPTTTISRAAGPAAAAEASAAASSSPTAARHFPSSVEAPVAVTVQSHARGSAVPADHGRPLSERRFPRHRLRTLADQERFGLWPGLVGLQTSRLQRRASAATRSPSRTTSRSPGTTSSAGTSCSRPSRTTTARRVKAADSARIARSAPSSCENRRRVENDHDRDRGRLDPLANETDTTAAPTKRATRGSTNCLSTSRKYGGRPTARGRFGPYNASRFAAVAVDNPRPASTPRTSHSTSTDAVCGASRPSSEYRPEGAVTASTTGAVDCAPISVISSPYLARASGLPRNAVSSSTLASVPDSAALQTPLPMLSRWKRQQPSSQTSSARPS